MVEGLGGVAPEGSGCVLVAEMSSEGTLATGDYTKSKRAGCQYEAALLTCFGLAIYFDLCRKAVHSQRLEAL